MKSRNFVKLLFFIVLTSCSIKNDEIKKRLDNLINLEQCDSAKVLFEKEFEEKKTPVYLLETRALIYECVGDYSKAINYRLIHVNTFPNDKKSYFRLGFDYFFKKEFSKAKIVFEKLYLQALTDSSRLKYLNNVGMIYHAQNDYVNLKKISDKELYIIRHSNLISNKLKGNVYFNRVAVCKGLELHTEANAYLDSAKMFEDN